jgi:hypothetical protein
MHSDDPIVGDPAGGLDRGSDRGRVGHDPETTPASPGGKVLDHDRLLGSEATRSHHAIARAERSRSAIAIDSLGGHLFHRLVINSVA